MRRSKLLVLASAALLALAQGCDDDAAIQAKAAADKAHKDAEDTVKFIENAAEDPRQFADVMKAAGKARVLAWGDPGLCTRIEDGVAKARTAREGQLKQLFEKVHKDCQSALDKKDPAESDKACSGALDELSRLSGPALAAGGTKADEDRKALVERQLAAKRALEVISKENELVAAESFAQARALVKSYDLDPTWAQSPFQPLVMSLLQKIPEKGPGDSAETMIIFDGSSDDQFSYFDLEYNWPWKKPRTSANKEDVILGDNTDSTEEEACMWIGDDTWGDIVVEVEFNVGEVGLNFHLRQKDDKFDKIEVGPSVAPKGDWVQARIEVRGNKAVCRVNGQKLECELREPKGKFGIALPPMGLVKVKAVRLKLLDKDAKKPQMHAAPAEGGDDDTPDPKKKKKKKTG
ncbi:MAG TPA: hypothetical protein VFF73_06575 [Planctomycetota bacterium]|nr:hypothetical protein [Planctomycetota bacterium]